MSRACMLLWLAGTAMAVTLGFQPPITYPTPTGTAPAGVAAGDFDGDGKMDLAVSNSASGDDGSVSILIGNGDGTFKAAMNFSACKNCYRIAAGDFNGDGKSDLAMVRPGDPNVSDNGDLTIFLSNGDGTFHKGQVLTPGQHPVFAIAADVNADRRPDLIVSSTTDDWIAVLLGDSDGTFQAHIYQDTQIFPQTLAVADFNQDGKADLAVAGKFGANIVGIMLGNGDGSFQAPVGYPSAGLFGVNIASGDFNQDSRTDLVVTVVSPGNVTRSSAALLLGNGDGTFSPGVFGSGSGACQEFDPTAADFDGDGKLDLALVANDLCLPTPKNDPRILVLVGKGDGSFQTSMSLPGRHLGIGADLNGDKAPDLVTLNGDSNIGVLLNNGTDFSISTSKPTPATVSRGQSSTSTVTVTLLNAFDNPVALACSVEPAGVGAPTCSLGAESVTPEPNGSATTTLTINTGTAAAVGFMPFAWLLAPVVSLVLVRVSRWTGKLMSSLAGGVFFAALLTQLACGGGGNGKAQDYTITITGSSTFAEHSTSLTVGVR
jgi:FG-GAP-like repeat